MSDLRDALGAWANDRGEEVAASVRVQQGATRAAAGRRRAGNLSLAAGAAVLGLVAASGIAVAGPWRGTDPAPATTGEPPKPGAIACGAPWTLEEGTITHDPSAPAYFGGVSGGWVVHTDNGEVIENPSSLWVGYEGLSWEGVPLLNGDVVVQATVVPVQDGVIAGQPNRAFLNGAATVSVPAPLPEVCNDGGEPPTDGMYVYHLVVTAALADNPEVVLQTIVDPGGSLLIDVSELANAPIEPAIALEEPVGDTYQAFLMHKLDEGSCTPYQDALDAGEPTNGDAIDYSVTIPGVQGLTGDVWANEPAVVIDDASYTAWYVGLPTAIIATEFDGGDPLGALGWTTGPAVGESEGPGTLRLVNTGDAAPVIDYGAGCNFVQPVPTIGGAVYLVIDGVDWDAVGEKYPFLDVSGPNDFQTWVYLGQAES